MHLATFCRRWLLSLFKPWRYGRDLKGDDESWDEAFNQFTFDFHQQELMKFFNLRYECLDVQDDFHAELRKGNNPHNYEDIDKYVLDTEDDDNCDTFQSGDELDGYNHNRITVGMQVGKLQKAMLNKMESIENVMRVSGWFNKLRYTVKPMGKDYINSD